MKTASLIVFLCLFALVYESYGRAQEAAAASDLRVKLAQSESTRQQLQDQLAEAADKVDDLRSSVDDLSGAVDEFGHQNLRDAVEDVKAAAADVDQSTSDVESTLSDTPSSTQFIAQRVPHHRRKAAHRPA